MDNRFGQLGDGTTTDSPVPVTVAGLPDGIRAISAGGIATCALTRDGGMKCWGSNSAGQLGDGSTVNSSAPVDVLGLTSGISALAAGPDHTCAVARAGGVKCWGNNGGGQLGDDSAANMSSPVDVYELDTEVVALATGYDHTCALTRAGGVKCWGSNFYGELGDGTSGTHSTFPVDVVGLVSGATAIAAGDSANHTCALTSEGGVKCWGYNAYGQLGNGSATDSGTPVDVLGLASRADSVAVGYYHSCALMTTGAVKCWGNNSVASSATVRRSTALRLSMWSSGRNAGTSDRQGAIPARPSRPRDYTGRPPWVRSTGLPTIGSGPRRCTTPDRSAGPAGDRGR